MQDAITSTIGSALKFVISTVLWSMVLFNFGRVTLLIFTLGRYPRGLTLKQHVNRISSVGALVVVVLWASIAVHNNFAQAKVASFRNFLQDETYASSGTALSNNSFKPTPLRGAA